MLEARKRWKRVAVDVPNLIRVGALALVLSLTVMPTPSPAATTMSPVLHDVVATSVTRSLHSLRQLDLPHPRAPRVVAEPATVTTTPTPSDGYVVNLIHQDFPEHAWHDAEAVAWCESKFRTTDIGFDSNGTHDRGIFQLNDGGTEQYLMAMIGQNANNVNLAFNPVLNVRAAALLYKRDGWSQWSCESAI
jgi:hypothetical protein